MPMGLGLGLGLGSRSSKARVTSETLAELSHELILPMQLLDIVEDIEEGKIVRALANPWQSIFEQLKRNPDLLFEFAANHRAFEEFIAGSYEKAGFDKVILTPASGDLGRDVIAEKRGLGTIKVLDQCKAFGKGRLVSANDVRAMIGTWFREGDASRAVVTTTADFAPGIWSEWEDHLGKRLDLRNGQELLKWINLISDKEA